MIQQANNIIRSTVGGAMNLFQSGLSNPASWLMELLGSNKASTGVIVNTETALSVPEIYNAVTKISGHLACMPLQAWDRDGEMVQSAGCDVWNRPSPWTRSEIVEKVMIDALLLGNGRAYIHRNGLGVPTALYPIQSLNTRTVMVNGSRWHLVPRESAVEAGIPEDVIGEGDNNDLCAVPDYNMFYVIGCSVNGYWGENLLSLARDTIGLSVTGTESAGVLYQNTSRPGILLKAPRNTFRNTEEAEKFLEQFRSATDGVENAGKTAMIKDGMEAVQMQWQSMDTSHVSMRQFQRESAALLFRLESVIGTDTSVYRGVTEKSTAYLINCLLPWMNKIQGQADSKLLSLRTRSASGGYTKLSLEQIWQSDRTGLALYTSSLRQQGVVSTDEVRNLHGMPPAVSDEENDYTTDYQSLAGNNTAEAGDPTEEQQSSPGEGEADDEPPSTENNND